MARFQNMDKKIGQIEQFLQQYGIDSLEEADEICRGNGLDTAHQF